MSERALRWIAGILYAVAHLIYDTARRIDRYSYGVPWKDTK